MDFRRQRAEHSPAVRIDRNLAVGTVLRSRTGDGRESAIDATAGRAVHTNTVLRGSEDGLVAGRARMAGQSEAGAATDASDGTGGDLRQTASVASLAGAQDLSVSVARSDNQPAGPGLVQRHHV